jgi:hypothetical protein
MARKWLLVVGTFMNRLFHQRRRKPLLVLLAIHRILMSDLHLYLVSYIIILRLFLHLTVPLTAVRND